MCKPDSCVIRCTVHWAPYLFAMFEIIANITPLILFCRHGRGKWVLIVLGLNIFHRILLYLLSLVVLECKTGIRETTRVVPINNYLSIEMLIRVHEIIFWKYCKKWGIDIFLDLLIGGIYSSALNMWLDVI